MDRRVQPTLLSASLSCEEKLARVVYGVFYRDGIGLVDRRRGQGQIGPIGLLDGIHLNVSD